MGCEVIAHHLNSELVSDEVDHTRLLLTITVAVVEISCLRYCFIVQFLRC